MPLSLNEIRDRALAFAKEWEGETSEHAEAKSFWDGFFNVFGVNRRRVATFEKPVKKATGHGGFIDLLWKGVLLVEHKSQGKDLDRAKGQAFDYFAGLKDRDLPRYVIVSDFARIRLYDLEAGGTYEEFPLSRLPDRISLFGFMSGYEPRPFGVEDPANIEAADRLGDLHDLLADSGYAGHPLRVLMVRTLFCLFADDTMLFEKGAFRQYVERRTSEDGADLGMRLSLLFDVLNTPREDRQTTLDEEMAAFPYVNGKLFEERLPLPSFNAKMRDALLEAAALDWSRISPAIFGSLFQSIMDKEERRKRGAHYTTEANILKVINPLFMDGLREEFKKAKGDIRRLRALHEHLGAIRILDPACGCGNFLVIAYREMRALELDILRELQRKGQMALDISLVTRVDVDQFYGIEIDEWPARIAEVAMWMMDHQMNVQASKEFGKYFVRIPLRKSPTIIQGNALRMDWETVIAPQDLTYIVGNPPFLGSKFMNAEQKADSALVFGGLKGQGVLDYVACWYWKSAGLMEINPSIRAALVSTNSITQGEQVAALWPPLIARGVRLNFAHRTFQWSSEASGKATVQCVILGFALHDVEPKTIFAYENARGTPSAISAAHINPYLLDADDTIVWGRTKPLTAPLPVINGSIVADGGHLILSSEERDSLLLREPMAAPYLRRFVGAEDLLNDTYRYCLWLADCPPSDLAKMTRVKDRVAAVREFRLASTKEATVAKAATPSLFTENRQPPTGTYLALPRTSSEHRRYFPIGFLTSDIVAANDLQIVPGGGDFEFGVLSSAMHMAWMRITSGRLGSSYRYSAKFTYNTFVWPSPAPAQKRAVEDAARAVKEARARHAETCLARLYDATTMPPNLALAHIALDRAVDAAYGGKKFSSEADRVAFLFRLYQERTAPLIQVEKPKRGRKKAAG